MATILLGGVVPGCGAATTAAARRSAAAHAEGWLEGTSTSETVGALRALEDRGEATAADLAMLGAALELLGRPTAAAERLGHAVEAGVRQGTPAGLLAAEGAAAQLMALEDRAAGYGDLVSRLGVALEGRASSPRLVAMVQDMRLRLARRRGRTEDAAAAVSASGCLTHFRAAGPFGPLPLSSFDVVHSPARPGALPQVVELGAGRGRAAAFEPVVRGCEVELSSPGPQWGGTTYAATYVELEAAGEVALRVESLASVRVFVNDELVLSRDRRRAYLPAAHLVELWLPRGRSKILVAATGRYPSPVFRAALTGPGGEALPLRSTSDGAGGYSPASPVVHRDSEHEWTDPSGTERYLLARVALSEGRTERVRQLLDQGPSALRESAPGIVLRAISWAADRTVPYDVARNRALSLLRQAGELEAGAWLPYYERARHHAEEERYEEALAIAAAGVGAAPEQPALRLLLGSLLTARGLWQETLAALDEARRLVPDACEPLEARWALARGRERVAEELEAARELSACDRSSDALALALTRTRRWREAEAEIRRIIELEGERPLLLINLAEVLRGRGAVDEEVQVLERVMERNPEDRAALLDLVDLSESGLWDSPSAEVLDRTVAGVPADLLVERRLRALLAGGDLLEDFHLDGRAAIAAYEEDPPSYDVPSVLVLDHTVFRAYSDGSVVELTHGVTRVLTDEGIELEGELEVPRGAVVLAVRTIKPDGTVLEPEDIRGKDTLSFPGLEVGDYVESAYIRGHEPPPEFPGGMWPWRFYFQGHRRAFHFSELAVVAPTDMTLDVSTRGAEVERTERVVGGLRMLRWTARGMGTLSEEPDGPHGDEVAPSVLVSSGASWSGYRDALREALADRDRPSSELRRLAEAVVEEGGATDDAARLDALFRWVARNVEAGGGALDSVSHMLAARTGERTRLLGALARALDIEVRVGFARSSTADQTEDDVPSLSTYGYPVVFAAGRWFHVGERARWSPSCYMPPDLRGQQVLMVDGEELFDHLGGEPCAPDRVAIEGELRLEEDGTATGRVTERHTGIDGVLWRYRLSRIEESDRQGAFEETYAADALPGAEVTSLEVLGEDDVDQPLVMTYEVSGVRLAEIRGDTLELLFPFPSELGRYAALPARRTPLVVHEPVERRVTVVVELPAAARAEPPGAAMAAATLGDYAAVVDGSASGRLSLERSLELRAGRVQPSEYGTFASFCRRVDEVEGTPLRVRLTGRGSGR